MKCCFPAFLIVALGLALVQSVVGQDFSSQIDLLYPEFAHPRQQVTRAIHRRDFRFIAVDRERRLVPGAERYPRLCKIYGIKYVPQRFRLFPNRSQNFSFNLRARAYAEQYNRELLRFLLARPRKK